MNRKVAAAARLYKSFSGHAARAITVVRAPDHDTHLLVGELEGVAYNTIRDGTREKYVHEFRQDSRPLLTASHDGTRLYLLDGAYRFTDRGIVDRGRTMAAEIALVNPKPRRKGRSAAQKAATRRMIAARWGQQVARKAKTNPSKKHHKRSGGSRAVTLFKRNPAPRMGNFVSGELVPAAIGAASGLGINVLVGYLPLPATLKTGMVRSFVVIGAAVGVGALSAMAFGRKTGELVAAGAITVTLYDVLKGLLITQFPNVPLQPTAIVAVPTAAVGPPATGAVAGWTSPAMQMGDTGTYVEGDGMMGSTLLRAY
jgi:hypothetical protein